MLSSWDLSKYLFNRKEKSAEWVLINAVYTIWPKNEQKYDFCEII